ncbi:MAG: hypothetical protein U1E33_02495 [Rhodospirillales bacterium]
MAGHVSARELTDNQDAIAKLNWQFGPESRRLAEPKAIIKIGNDEAFLEGDDAHEFMHLIEGHKEFKT